VSPRAIATAVALTVPLIALSLAECGGSAAIEELDASVGHDAGVCRSNADCVQGTVCAFNPDDGCGAVGSCVVGDDNTHAPLTSCGCDGHDISSAYGLDLNATPARHLGSCADGVCLFEADAQSLCPPTQGCTAAGCSTAAVAATACGVMACACLCADPSAPTCDCR
jgi:hypothetical protein